MNTNLKKILTASKISSFSNKSPTPALARIITLLKSCSLAQAGIRKYAILFQSNNLEVPGMSLKKEQSLTEVKITKMLCDTQCMLIYSQQCIIFWTTWRYIACVSNVDLKCMSIYRVGILHRYTFKQFIRQTILEYQAYRQVIKYKA